MWDEPPPPETSTRLTISTTPREENCAFNSMIEANQIAEELGQNHDMDLKNSNAVLCARATRRTFRTRSEAIG
jgi:hypothetical protein